MKQLVYPGKWVATQHQTWQLSWLVQKSHEVGFTFLQIFVSEELKVMSSSILLAWIIDFRIVNFKKVCEYLISPKELEVMEISKIYLHS